MVLAQRSLSDDESVQQHSRPLAGGFSGSSRSRIAEVLLRGLEGQSGRLHDGAIPARRGYPSRVRRKWNELSEHRRHRLERAAKNLHGPARTLALGDFQAVSLAVADSRRLRPPSARGADTLVRAGLEDAPEQQIALAALVGTVRQRPAEKRLSLAGL